MLKLKKPVTPEAHTHSADCGCEHHVHKVHELHHAHPEPAVDAVPRAAEQQVRPGWLIPWPTVVLFSVLIGMAVFVWKTLGRF